MGLKPFSNVDGMETMKRVVAHEVDQVIAYKAESYLLENLGIDLTHQIECYPKQNPSLIATAVKKSGPFEIAEKEIKPYREAGRLYRCLLLDAFQRMGVFTRSGERYEGGRLGEQLSIMPKYSRLCDVLLELLIDAGFIKKEGGEIVTTEELDKDTLGRELEEIEANKGQLVRSHKELRDFIELTWKCVRAYPGILRGEVPATDIMFPNSSTQLVEGLYKNNKAADHYNRLVSRNVYSYVVARVGRQEQAEKIRILEVGAGTGGTSAGVLEALKEYGEKVEYVYTDISKAFTLHGQKEYGAGYPFVEFKMLDIEKEIEVQGYRRNDFDVVIATNVLHATRDMKKTLRNVKALLKTNGWLVINEGTAVSDFATLTFGLLEGWWLFEDEGNRIKGSPLLSSRMWEQLLKEEGFDEVVMICPTGSEGREHFQNVMIGESNGKVRTGIQRQKRREKDSRKRQQAEEQRIEGLQEKAPENGKIKQEQLLSGHEKRDYIEDKIVESVAGVLRIERGELNPEEPFMDLGVDSILAVEIVNRVNERLSVKLKTNDLFNYPTIQRLSSYISEEIVPGSDCVPQVSAIETAELFKSSTDITKKTVPPSLESGNDGNNQHINDNAIVELLNKLDAGEIGIEEVVDNLTS